VPNGLAAGSLVRRGPPFFHETEEIPMIGTVLIVILVLMLIGALPNWSHSAKWGYGPSGGVGIILLVLLVLVLTGRI
jgi:hypothetical protein